VIGAIDLWVGASRLAAEGRRAGKTVWRAESEHSGSRDLGEALAGLAAELPARLRTWPVQVRLAPPLVQLRTLDGIPPVRQAALRPLLAQQVDRYFRRAGQPLVVDARWIGPKRQARTRVRAAAAQEALVTAVITGLEAAGLRVAAVGVAGANEDVGLDLLPPGERLRRTRRRRATTRHLAVVAAAAWAVAVGASLADLYRERRALAREQAALAGPLAALRTAQGEVDAARDMVAAIEATSEAQAAFSIRLAAVARSLPDSAFLTSLTLNEAGRGSITGVARRAAQVVATLEADRSIGQARLDGPSVHERIRGSDWERFVIAVGEPGAP
jgi:Tfp pilus assembly protein PilN